MEIPYKRIAPATLKRMIEEFVTRDGTDYGLQETPLESKVSQVMSALEKGDAHILYDEQREAAEIVLRAQGLS